MIHPKLNYAQRRFFAAYEEVKSSVDGLPHRDLVDLKHEAEEIRRSMTSNFSQRAAAEMVYAATTLLLESK